MVNARPVSGPFRVVVVDADPVQRRALTSIINGSSGRFSSTACATSAEAVAAIGADEAIVLADLETIGGAAHVGDIGARLIATSANGSLGAAVNAVRGGAFDFLPKPIGAKALIERLEAAIGARADDKTGKIPASPPPAADNKARPAKAMATAPAVAHTDFAGFVGRSPAMRALYEQIRLIAPSRAPVFVTGESGTGKELTAEAIHQHGGRPEGPFIAINCSAIPRELMESEIFGHVKGAFTGAADSRVGAAERADGGTLFLDEIGEMDLGLQAKLLRFLQSGTVQRVGGGEPRSVDVRIVCATNRDPEAEVASGRFRADLFYRLHVLPIHLQPLRERREDIVALAAAFLDRFASEERRGFAGFTAEAAACLAAFAWPGNVRQLGNVIRRIVVLNDGTEVSRAMLPAAIAACAQGNDRESGVPAGATPRPAVLPLWQEERRIIEGALDAFGGNISRAAAALEINPSTIYRKRLSWEERGRSGN